MTSTTMSSSLPNRQTPMSTLLPILRSLPNDHPAVSRIISYIQDDNYGLKLSGFLPIKQLNRILHDFLRAPAPTDYHFDFDQLETNVRLLRFLLFHGAQVNARHPKDPFLRTPLFWAVYFKRLHDVKFLLENGAKVNTLSRSHYALSCCLPEFDFCNFRTCIVNTSCLMVGIERGSLEIVELLLEHGADLSHAISHASLFDSATRGDLPMVKLLVAHGASVHQTDLLFRKCCQTEQRLAKLVASPNADPASVTRCLSRIQKQIECLTFLLCKGAPAVSPDAFSQALQFRRFLTLCRVYQFCAANWITIALPKVFPATVYSEETPLIPSGLEILAELMRTLPRTRVIASNDFLFALGVVAQEDKFLRLKDLCIDRIRKSLFFGKSGHQFVENVSALGLPFGISNILSMKKVNARIKSELLAHVSGQLPQQTGGFTNEMFW